MRVMLRRERRRRNIMDFQGHSLPLPHNALVERNDLLNHTARYTDYRILVTRDKYLAFGVRHSPVPLCLCRIYDDIDEALQVVHHILPLCLIIDLEGWSQPTLILLDRLRALQKKHPAMEIALITPDTDSRTRLFLQASCGCRIIDKRLALLQARSALQLNQELPKNNLPVSVPRRFKSKEWSVLMLMSQGHSLCHIARMQLRPYHRIIYRVGCVLSLLKLGHRQQLLRLIQRINGVHDHYQSG
jgi:fimbrial regulator